MNSDTHFIFDSSSLELFKDYKDEAGNDIRVAMIRAFIDLNDRGFQDMGRLLETDPGQFRMAIHSLKSSAASMGGVTLAEICQQLETETLDSDKKKRLLDVAHEAFKVLKVNLENYLKEM